MLRGQDEFFQGLAEESTEDSDADVDDGSDSSESHIGGTITPTVKKR